MLNDDLHDVHMMKMKDIRMKTTLPQMDLRYKLAGLCRIDIGEGTLAPDLAAPGVFGTKSAQHKAQFIVC